MTDLTSKETLAKLNNSLNIQEHSAEIKRDLVICQSGMKFHGSVILAYVICV